MRRRTRPERPRGTVIVQPMVYGAIAAMWLSIAMVMSAQSPDGQGAASQGPVGQSPAPQAPASQAPVQDSGRGVSPASRRPPPTVTPQSYAPEQVQAGQRLFAAQCGFCHGRDAMGGESGPDLTRSTVVAEDARGDKIGPVLRNGRIDKGMPSFNLSDGDLSAVIAFVHDVKTTADSQLGGRRAVDAADLQTGNIEAGRQYFAGACASCHSPSGDLAGLATRFKGLALLQRMLYPVAGRGGGSAPKPPQVTVTLPSGQTIAGKLANRDEFTITMVDADGWSRSWPVNRVKFTVIDPLEAHFEQLGKYTDDDMHNVFAYLQTLE